MITDERRYRKLVKDKNKKLSQIENLKVDVEIIDEEMKQITLNYVDTKLSECNLSLYDLVKILDSKEDIKISDKRDIKTDEKKETDNEKI